MNLNLGILFKDGLFLFVVGFMVAILIFAICYKVSQFIKGRLKLQVNGQRFGSGDVITGTVSLKTRKRLFADKFYVALVCESGETSQKMNSSGGYSSSTNWVEFYRKQQDFMIQEEVPPGFEERYDIGIEVPTMDEVVQEVGEEGIMGRSKRWRVITRFEMRGVDFLQWKEIGVELN